ncbi:hypothetical protein GETHLI_22060 [Geothrix limicola]|uniref:Tetratricopeptide repeat protein n=2 Tax=Geothrix limicola TaxID=2927978 RepID=A0ABQ5QFU8_9BACT|nr:hypothetical protein GETHLI_22060 [Geothrix limicola]
MAEVSEGMNGGVPPGVQAASIQPDRVVWLKNGKTYPSANRSQPRSWRLPLGMAFALMLVLTFMGILLWTSRHRGPETVIAKPHPNVLVLPTRVIGPPETAYLTDAVPTTLSTLLADVEGLDTKLPPTRLEMEAVNGDLREVAELYQVRHLITSTVTARGGRLAFDFKLSDAATRKVIWARQTEGAKSEYCAMIRMAANSIREILKPESVLPATNQALGSELELTLAEGKHFCRRYWHLGLKHDFDLALAALRRAEGLDASRPEIHAWMAILFNDHYWKTRAPGSLKSAKSSVVRALELDPHCGQAWMVRSWMETNLTVNVPEKALEYAVKAACFNPRDPRIQQGLGTVAAGSNGIFIATGRRSMELDPLDVGGYSWAALGLIWNDRAQEGLPIAERALRLEPNSTFNRFLTFFALFRLNRMEEAQRILASDPRAEESGFGADVMLAMSKGDLVGARNLANKTLTKWRKPSVAGSMDWANRALFYCPLLVRLGLKEDALWLLQRSLEARNPPPFDWLLIDPDLQQLKIDPRFKKVLSGARDFARVCVRHLDQARIQSELPSYLVGPLAELQTLVNRPLSP